MASLNDLTKALAEIQHNRRLTAAIMERLNDTVAFCREHNVPNQSGKLTAEAGNVVVESRGGRKMSQFYSDYIRETARSSEEAEDAAAELLGMGIIAGMALAQSLQDADGPQRFSVQLTGTAVLAQEVH
jgi:hypothetical protein